jgi:hypothetical protein
MMRLVAWGAERISDWIVDVVAIVSRAFVFLVFDLEKEKDRKKRTAVGVGFDWWR